MWVWFWLPPEIFKHSFVCRGLLRHLATHIILSTERSSLSAVCSVFIYFSFVIRDENFDWYLIRQKEKYKFNSRS